MRLGTSHRAERFTRFSHHFGPGRNGEAVDIETRAQGADPLIAEGANRAYVDWL